MSKFTIGRNVALASVLCSAVAFSVGLSGCQSTPTQRSTSETIEDAALTASVKSKIASAEGIGDALRINVDTYRGVVSLSGFLETQQQIVNAMTAAMSVQGIKAVKNNMSIKPRS